jgi:anti-sigma regulatory factor (Ser/Thr protein kinase)
VSPSPSIHLFLGPDTSAPSRARQALRLQLESVLEADVLDQAMLLVSELVTNSVRHGGLRPDQEIELTVHASPHHLRVEVAEPGEGFEVTSGPLPPQGIPTGGWGLYLVDRLSSAWGVEGGDVTKVWFELHKLSG